MKKLIFVLYLFASIILGIHAAEENNIRPDLPNISKARVVAMRLAKSSCHGIEWLSWAIKYASLPLWIIHFYATYTCVNYPDTVNLPKSTSLQAYTKEQFFDFLRFFGVWATSLITQKVSIHTRRKILPAIDPQACLAISQINRQQRHAYQR